MEIKILLCAFLGSSIFALCLAALMAEHGDDSLSLLRRELESDLDSDPVDAPLPVKQS